MVADQEAYDFFIKNDTDLFSEYDAFDGVHGMMAYNRTIVRKVIWDGVNAHVILFGVVWSGT